jgi:diacylglycerol kinase family enzyme
VRLREKLRGYLGKWPAAGVAFMVAAGSQHRISVTLQVGGDTIARRTRFVWIGLGWGSFPRVQDSLERRAEPDLEVAILHTDTRREGVAFLMRLAAALLRGGGPVRDPELEIVHGRSVVLDSPHRIDATADGEPLRLHTPVRLGVRDRALRVVAGASYRSLSPDLVEKRRTS